MNGSAGGENWCTIHPRWPLIPGMTSNNLKTEIGFKSEAITISFDVLITKKVLKDFPYEIRNSDDLC